MWLLELEQDAETPRSKSVNVKPKSPLFPVTSMTMTTSPLAFQSAGQAPTILNTIFSGWLIPVN